jgi:carbonyl reductase 1
LDAIVNNAGIGTQHGTPEEIMNVNFFGPKRVVDSFGAILRENGRVVNVGSGSGPSYVKNCPPEAQKLLCNDPESWEQIVSWGVKSADGLTGLGSGADGNGGYGLSKALLASYTRLLAKETKWQVSCCTPGFIDTKLTAGWGAKKTPEEGTLAIKKCLFEPLEGNGWYYGSDGVRSPYHFMRNPGEPAYDGIPPY